MASEEVDCVVVGAGPAGLSAALWLGRLGVSGLVLERGQGLGGELSRINLPIRDYLGCSARNGRELLDLIEQGVDAQSLPVRLSCGVETIDLELKRVTTRSGQLQARALILAQGLRRRPLVAPGLCECGKRGISYSGTTDVEQIAGGPVVVVGGGDGALENALILADRCPLVHLVHREASLRGQPRLLQQVHGHDRIRRWEASEVVAVHGRAGRLEALDVATPAGPERLQVPWLVIKIGFEPNTEAFRSGPLELDPAGYVVVDRYLHTSVPGVFAAGDMSNPRAPSIAAAVGDGAVAAREVSQYLWAEGGGVVDVPRRAR